MTALSKRFPELKKAIPIKPVPGTRVLTRETIEPAKRIERRPLVDRIKEILESEEEE